MIADSTALAAFLTARLDEIEQLATAAIPCIQRFDWEPAGNWTAHYDSGQVEDLGGHIVVFADSAPTEAQARHIAFHHPQRVLADVAAKRAILAEVTSWKHHYDDDDSWHSCSQAVITWGDDDRLPGSGCGDDDRAGKPCDCGLDQRQALILTSLAVTFSWHRDYDQTWRLP